MLRSRARRHGGNMLVFIVAVIAGLLLLLCFFALRFVRILGANQEQNTAVECAALAAARDLGRIVVEDPNFGLISLSDYTPAGPNTKAGDGQAMPVTSINTLLGTIRLDMIIAGQIGEPTMQQLAQRDYNNAMQAKDYLAQKLQQAVSSSNQNFTDISGNPVDVSQDTINAYEANIVRMTGEPTQLDRQSVRIKLGCLNPGGATVVPVPQPAQYQNVPASSTATVSDANGGQTTTYKSYVDCPFNGYSFVFAGVGRNVMLVNPKTVVPSVTGLAYAIPSIVQVEADEIFMGSGASGQGQRKVHGMACAQPASVYDPRPNPGAFKVTLPDGKIPELNRISDLYQMPNISTVPITLKTPNGADYPGGVLVPVNPPLLGPTPPLGQVAGANAYHWFRRAGTKAHVKSVVNAMNKNFTASLGAATPVMHTFEFNMDGTVAYTPLPAQPGRVVPGSDYQLYGENLGGALPSNNGNSYDIISSDAVINPGRLQGGIHGGEPIQDASLAVAPLEPMTVITSAPEKDDFSQAALFMAFGAAFMMCLRSVVKGGNRAMTVGAIVSIIGLTACGGAPPPPPPQALTTTMTGPMNLRPTYVRDGMAIEMAFPKH